MIERPGETELRLGDESAPTTEELTNEVCDLILEKRAAASRLLPMTNYQIRRSRTDESFRWKIHHRGTPNAVVGTTLTRWGARHKALAWQLKNDRASRSYDV